MTEELNGNPTSPAPESTPSSPTPVQQPAPPVTTPATLAPQAAPAEQAPQYLTREDALALIAERDKQWQQRYETLAKEQGQRGAQSYLDKRRLEERMKSTEATIQGLIRDGLLDESQASTYRERARTEALTDLLTEEPEQPQPGGGVQQPGPQTEADRIAWHLINQAGLTEADPEWSMILDKPDFPSWHAALEQAKAAKAARLARTQAQASAQPPPATPAPAAQPAPPTGAQAVEVGAGGGAAVTDLATLRQQYLAASRKGDRKRSQELYTQIQALTVGAVAK